ncbi:MAG: protein kinase [Myxococcales bacterium]|nr:protein kinase [Myxococcales bacterium]
MESQHARFCESCSSLLPSEGIFCPACGQPNLVGQLAGVFRLLGRLGAGGMGVVYKAEHSRLQTPFAVKILHHSLASNPKTAERFLREAKTTSKLRHEHIVFLADYGEIEGVSPYLAMEFLEGCPLSALLEQQPNPPFSRIFPILLQLCQTMSYAHKEGVIHRDIKPDNLFLLQREAGQPDFLKLLDFGIAKIVEEQGEDLTKTGALLGTPHYIAPEQITGRGVDHRADIFATGVLLFQMFTGEMPFVGKTVVEILTQRLLAPAPLLETFHPAWRGSLLAKVIEDALQIIPQKRLSSMQELHERLVDAQAQTLSLEARLLNQEDDSKSSVPVGPLASGIVEDQAFSATASMTLGPARDVVALPSGSDFSAVGAASPKRSLGRSAPKDQSPKVLQEEITQEDEPLKSPSHGALRWVVLGLGVLLLAVGLIWGLRGFKGAAEPPPKPRADATSLAKRSISVRRPLLPSKQEPSQAPAEAHAFSDAGALSEPPSKQHPPLKRRKRLRKKRIVQRKKKSVVAGIRSLPRRESPPPKTQKPKAPCDGLAVEGMGVGRWVHFRVKPRKVRVVAEGSRVAKRAGGFCLYLADGKQVPIQIIPHDTEYAQCTFASPKASAFPKQIQLKDVADSVGVGDCLP